MDTENRSVPDHSQDELTMNLSATLENSSVPNVLLPEAGSPTATVVIDNIVLPTICACGILGIILTVVVLSRKNMSTSTNCYLMGLAIADLLFLLLSATNLGLQWIDMSHPGHYVSRIYSAYANIFLNIFLMTSIWITVMLAVERYIAICQPFMAAKVCTVTHARIFIGAIFVFAFLARMVNFWELRVVSACNLLTNETVRYLYHTELTYDPHYNIIYPWLVDVLLASVLPFILLLLLNGRLIWEVKKSTKYIRSSLASGGGGTSVQREELQITVMLISVIIVFFICQAPYVIYTALASITTFSTSRAIMVFRHITMMLLTIKSSVNFILYCWFSEKFWATLKRVFCANRCAVKRSGSYYSFRRHSNCTRDTVI